MINLGYRSTPDYPYDYRIELLEYGLDERQRLGQWLQDLAIPHTVVGRDTSGLVYLRHEHARLFSLRWA